MRKFVKTIFIILIGSLLMAACRNSNSIVDKALSALLNSDNYKSEWFYESKLLYEGEMKEYENNGSILIFHHPYRSKASSSFDPSQDGITFGDFYETIEGDSYKQKTIYKLESGDTEEEELDSPISEEWLIKQIKKCLLSEEFVEEQTIEGINVKKYKISVTAYPFIIYFGFSFDANNIETRIFVDEYKECEGYIYINSDTDYIHKMEFDLSEKMVLNKKITERINNEIGHKLFTLPDYEKYKITIIISDINDDSKEVADIEKEIDRIMQ